jgi:hypothetical protein
MARIYQPYCSISSRPSDPETGKDARQHGGKGIETYRVGIVRNRALGKDAVLVRKPHLAPLRRRVACALGEVVEPRYYVPVRRVFEVFRFLLVDVLLVRELFPRAVISSA